MNTHDDEEDDSSPYKQPSTTDDEENDETENPIETAKPSPSSASDKIPGSLSSLYVLIKPSPVSTEYISHRVDIDGRDFNKAIIMITILYP